MKNFTLLFLLFTAPLLAFGQSDGCAQYKEGTFKVTDPASKKTSIITRAGNIQTEKMEDADEVYDFDLVWVDDCTYTITPTAATAARNKDLQKTGTVMVKITKVKGKSYIQRVTVASNPKFRRIDEVFVVPESK
jgi:hypothetical protein